MSKKNVWILEDDRTYIDLIYQHYLSEKYELKFFETLESFKKALFKNEKRPDFLICDLRLPDGSFYNLLQDSQIMGQINFPFMIVSFLDGIDILRYCKDHGAIDYMVKPINQSELLFRIEKGLNQAPLKKSNKNFIFNDLTEIESKIYHLLNGQNGVGISKEKIFSNVWAGVHVSEKSLNVHIYNIRKKISKFGFSIAYIQPNKYVLLSNRVDPSRLI